MRLFNFKKKQKPVVITIHGFGKRMHHQFDSISNFLRKNGYIERVGSKKAGYWKVL